MAIVALGCWLVTAGVGLYLLYSWLAHGGLRGTKVTRFPVTLLLGHPTLAVLALVTWLAYLVTARMAFAWTAFGGLVLVASLGFTMLTRWLTGRGGRHARGAEEAFPGVAVLAHGVAAITTFVLVFLTVVR